MRKVKKILSKNKELNAQSLKRISRAGAGLFQWVSAIVNYYGVARTVAPKRELVKRMEREMAKSQTDLKRIKHELGELQGW